MRAILVLLGLAVLVLAACLYFGIIRLDQTRAAVVQPPQFHADVGRVSVGKEQKTVTVPTINVEKPTGIDKAGQPGNAH